MTQPKNAQSYVLVDRARDEEHRQMMERIRESGECPFCENNFLKEHHRPILYEDDYWVVTTNIKPYDNTKYHFLFIAKDHAESIFDLHPEAGLSLFDHLRKIEVDYNLISGAVFMRFGNPIYNGGSVNHLHAHLIIPDIGPDKDWEKIRVKLGTNPK